MTEVMLSQDVSSCSNKENETKILVENIWELFSPVLGTEKVQCNVCKICFDVSNKITTVLRSHVESDETHRVYQVAKIHISSIWEIFTPIPGVPSATCNICTKPIKTPRSGTTGLHDHGKLHDYEATKRAVKRRHQIVDLMELKEKDLTPFEDLGAKMPLHFRLARLVAKDGLSFHVIQTSVDIREFAQAFIEKNKIPIHLPMSEKTVKEYIMEYGREAKKLLKLRIELYLASGKKFSCDFDEWTSTANRRYVNVTLFTSTNETWNLGLCRISGSASAENILKLVTNLLLSFGIKIKEDVVAATTDGASVMTKIRKDSGIEHQLCLVHGIQLSVTDCLYAKPRGQKSTALDSSSINNSHEDSETAVIEEEFEKGLKVDSACEISKSQSVELINSTISAAVAKVRQIVCFFKRSGKNNDCLQDIVHLKYQERAFHSEKRNSKGRFEKPLVLDVVTRWSSLFSMLERFWEIRDCVGVALGSLKKDILVTARDNYITWCIKNTLEPVKLVVEALCRRETNLLKARAILMVLFKNLQNQKNPFAKKFAHSLAVRLNERLSINFALIKYLNTGSYSNDYLQEDADLNSSESDDDDDDDYEPSVMDGDLWEGLDLDHFMGIDKDISKKDAILFVPAHELTIPKLFAIPPRHELESHIFKLLTRLDPVSNATPDPLNSEFDETIVVNKKPKTFAEKLNRAVDSASSVKSRPTHSQNLKSLISNEMDRLEATGQRGHLLQKCFEFVSCIASTSVESERAFSVAGFTCTKVKNRLNDDTLDTLCFLRQLFRNPVAFPGTK